MRSEVSAICRSKASAQAPSSTLARYVICKRIMDVGFTFALLTALSPFMIAIAALIRLNSPGPILLRQTRVGQNGREFQMLKFRSMHVDVDDRIHREMNIRELQGDRSPPGTAGGIFKLANDPRVTKS